MSGAKNCPETPRQKMIGMMYLVLTAMLALNVSTDILKGFSLVDRSLKVSIETSEARNTGLYGRMEDLNTLNPTKVGEWMNKSLEVKQKSDSLYNFIQNYKIETIRLADGKDTDPEGVTIKAQDNLDVAGTYANAHGKELREKIEDYRAFILEMYNNDSSKTDTYMRIFNTDKMKAKDGSIQPWEYAIFENQPLAAVATMLTKYQNDVRSAESELISYFIGQTDASDFRVNKIEAMVIPESKTVMSGSDFKAQIVLVALDTTKKPEYLLKDGTKLDTNIVVRRCGSVGSYTYEGQVLVTGNDGVVTPYDFATEYTVTAPSATIANMDMNVVYRGYTNRMSVSVPGVATEKLRVSCEGGTMEKSGNMWICKPTASGEVTINVFAEVEGRSTNMGSQKFRVRTLPDPQAFLRIQDPAGNSVDYTPATSKHRLRRTELVDGVMVAEYADGMLQATFKITDFTLLISDGRGGFTASQSTGNKFSDSQKTTLRKLKAGSIIIIDKIKVTGAKSTTLSYPPITLP